jgi:hypothetical protein
LLTNPDVRIVCVEPFERYPEVDVDMSAVEERFDRNVAPHAPKVTKLKGSSRFVLRELPLASFGFAYVDGSHVASAVLMDATFVWDLLKPGGIVFFDDYGGGADGLREALDAFRSCFWNECNVIHEGYQLVLGKLRPPQVGAPPLATAG